MKDGAGHRSRKGCILGVAILFAVLCLVPSGGNGQTLPDREEDPGTVLFEGAAPMPEKGDRSVATKAALADAEHRALLQAVSPLVEPFLLEQKRDFLINTLKARKEEILVREHLVSSGQDGDTWRVLIGARVRTDIAEEVLAGKLPPRIIVLTPSSRAPSPRAIPAPGVLRSAAKARHYKAVDPPGPRDERGQQLISSFHAGEAGAAKLLCLYLLARHIGESSVEANYSDRTGDIVSSRGSGSVKITWASGHSRVISVSDVKGFGSTNAKADRDAIGKTSALLALKTTRSLAPATGGHHAGY